MNDERVSYLRAVLLDVDGTLVDSNDAHAESWVRVLRAAGHEVTFEQVRPLIGMGGDKLLPTLAGIESESGEGKRLAEERWQLFRDEFLPALSATPGAALLVRRLRAAGLQPVVATSGKEDEARAILQQAGLAGLLPRRTSSDDAEESKPDPDIVHAALARAGAEPREAVLVGDTPYDIEAATRAGVRAIALRCGGWWSDADLAGAMMIVDDPATLAAQVELPGRASAARAEGEFRELGG